MAGRAVADLRAAVGVGGGRNLRIELNRSESEPGAIAIDEPHELAAQRHPRLIRRPLALRECRAEREGDREDREKELLHGGDDKTNEASASFLEKATRPRTPDRHPRSSLRYPRFRPRCAPAPA